MTCAIAGSLCLSSCKQEAEHIALAHIGPSTSNSQSDQPTSAVHGDVTRLDHDHGHSHDHGQAALHPSSDPASDCACAEGKAHSRWCKRCNMGYVAGLKIESAKLFEAMDPHGHELNVASMECAECRNAARSNGFCSECGIGFYQSMAYFSRLTWGLAQGSETDAAQFSCEWCRAHLQSNGWCDACARGLIGSVSYRDRTIFDATAREFDVLHAAINRLPQCEVCACAMVMHRTCPLCSISYQ